MIFGGIFITTSTTAHFPRETDASGLPDLLCTRCGNADALIIGGMGTLVPAAPGHVFIEYTCSVCGSIYNHGATVQQVASLLNAGATPPGVLHVGNNFIHCGEVLTETGEAYSRVARPAGRQRGHSAAISRRSRLLKCRCGLQLDVPY